jgi:hypothetical protein
LSSDFTVNGSNNLALNVSTGAVDSVFGRTGAVTASSGDYTASQINSFDEAAQDAVGNILGGQFTYNDTGNAITLNQGSGSSLDADTLDGKQGSAYAVLAQNEEFTSGLNITGDDVGIGTTSPDKELHLFGNNTTLRIEENSNSAFRLDLEVTFDNDKPVQLKGKNGTTFLSTSSGNFETNLHTSAGKVLTAKGGNVGIGTTSPSFALDVNGKTATDSLEVSNTLLIPTK